MLVLGLKELEGARLWIVVRKQRYMPVGGGVVP